MIRLGVPFFLFTFLAFLFQSVFLFIDKPDEFMAIPLALVLGGAGAYFIGRNKADDEPDFQQNIFLWAFSIRLWMGIIFYGWDMTGIFGDEDASGYLGSWRYFASNWYTDGISGFLSDLWRVSVEEQNIGHRFIWAVPMFVAGGPSRMIVSVVNSFAGSLLVVVIFRIARRIFGWEIARISAVMVTFWASMILLSAGSGKEILVIFFEWTILYLMVRNPKGLTVSDGLLAVPSMLAVFIMRFYAVYMLVAAVTFRFIVAQRKNLVRNLAFGSVVVISLSIFLTSSGVIDRDFERLERQSQVIDSWRENLAESTGSGVEVYSEYSRSTVAVPIATVYFFLAPFPWEIFSGSLRNAFGGVENLLIILILIVGFPAIKIFFVDKFVELAPIFVFCALYAGMHIWGLANVGLAWRHKQTVMPLLFMLAAVGFTQRKAGWNILKSKLRGERRLSVVPASRR